MHETQEEIPQRSSVRHRRGTVPTYKTVYPAGTYPSSKAFKIAQHKIMAGKVRHVRHETPVTKSESDALEVSQLLKSPLAALFSTLLNRHHAATIRFVGE